MPTIRENALSYLHRELRAARIALGRAETRPGVTETELENLRRKIDVLEWTAAVVLKEDEHENA